MSILSSDATAAPAESDSFPHLTDLKPNVPSSPPHFTDEAILILSEFSNVRNDYFDSWQDELVDYEDVQNKSLELYNWLALSLVRSPDQTVALTIYVYHDGFKLFVTTQQLSERAISHTNELVELVRMAARKGLDLVAFRNSYFQCLLRNCRATIDSRYNELRRAMREICESPDDDGDMRITQTALEELTGLLHSKRTRKKDIADRFGDADDEAQNLTGNNNIYVALGILLVSLKKAMTIPPTNDTIMNLCSICWILARSRVLQSCIYRENPTSANLMIKLGAMGAYYRGVGLLYQVMEDAVYKPFFEGLKVEFIPCPDPRKVELHDDWLHVMDTIYSRVKGGSKLRKPAPCSSSKVPSSYQHAVHSYSAHLSSGFKTHPEKHLISFLISRGYQARKVGVSAYCCFLCAGYVERLNQGNDIEFKVQNHERVSWSVGGHCGDVGMWARDEELCGVFANADAVVKKQIENKVCEIARDIAKSGPEGRGFLL